MKTLLTTLSTAIALLAIPHTSYAEKQLSVTGDSAVILGPSEGSDLTWDNNRFRYWGDKESVPTWTFSAIKAGKIDITINQSNFEIPGSTYEVSFAGTSHKLTVKDTGSWNNYEPVKAGTYHFKPGIHKLKVTPIEIKDRALMDMSEIIFSGDVDSLIEAKKRTHKRPGILRKLNKPHPSHIVTDLTPEELDMRVSGIDFLSDGTMAVCTWDQFGSVYLIKNYDGKREDMDITLFAEGIQEPLGLVVVDDVIYIQQKQELTRLIDSDGDKKCDGYETVCNAWEVSANFHEFCFSPIYKDGNFYLTLAIAVNSGGATTDPQVKDRGTLIKVDPKTGQYEMLSAGFRTPNGLSLAPNGEDFLIADNQGDWLPGNKLMVVKPGRFYNHRYNPAHPMSKLPVSPPAVWLPQNDIANSPTKPLIIKEGRFEGQILLGDIHHGGIRRIFLEEINGEYQGTAFRYAQDLRGGINRMEYGPDGHIYAGITGTSGNWLNGKTNGLLRIELSDKPVFELEKVQTMSNGLMLSFTQPLAQNMGWDPQYYKVESFTYKPTVQYGGPKVDRHQLAVKSASVSSDRTQVFLEIPNIKKGYIVHGTLDADITHDGSTPTWAGEWWTTVNDIPKGQKGEILPVPANAESILVIEDISTSPHANALTIFSENCASCHKVDNTKLIGPGLTGLLGKKQIVIRDGKEVEVTIDKAYLRKSILEPLAEHPKGYQPIMPAIGAGFKKSDIDDLVEWISTLK